MTPHSTFYLQMKIQPSLFVVSPIVVIDPLTEFDFLWSRNDVIGPYRSKH